jgi:hypothetical protein
MNGYQSPLGNAVRGLATLLMSQPTQAEQMTQAAQYQAMRASADKAAQDAAAAGAKVQGRSKLGALLADPRLTDKTFSPVGTPAPKFADGSEGIAVTPIAKAFQPDYGALTQAAVNADVNPNDLGGYVRFLAANTGGVRDPRTTNAQVGAGQGYTSTAESFDLGEAGKRAMNVEDNAAAASRNASTIAAENARAAAQRQNQLTIAGMTDDRADRRAQMAQDKLDKKEMLANHAAINAADVVLGKVDEALGKVSGMTAGIASVANKIPGTPGYTLDRDIDTIKANLSFDTLRQMRESSPTGGALGQVSDYENKMLGSTVAALDSGLPPAELKSNLQAVKKHYANVKALAEGKPLPFPSPGDKAAVQGGVDDLLKKYGH